MNKIVVNGGRTLYGEVFISGMKNAALPVIFASILAKDVCIIDNIPPVGDVSSALDILSELGAKVRRIRKNTVEIDTTYFEPEMPSVELAGKMRASAYLLGAELGRFGKAVVCWPGGCDFGTRPLDYHLKGFKSLGAECNIENGAIFAEAEAPLSGCTINLPRPSVGATVNLMMAAVFAEGTTIIEGAAREPHIIDLAGFLNNCGANIMGAGTSVIKIKGVQKLHGTTYKILPDMIEAGSYMAAVAATGGMVTIRSVVPKHLDSVAASLREMGVGVEYGSDYVTVSSNGILKSTDITTFYYPGFPTDMHPQFAALLAMADGVGSITEGVFDYRFRYVDQFRKMGAQIAVDTHKAIFTGTKLGGAPVEAVDLRAGVALIIAGLAAEGTTEISNIELIERGYYNIISKFRALGADIGMRYEPDAVVTVPATV